MVSQSGVPCHHDIMLYRLFGLDSWMVVVVQSIAADSTMFASRSNALYDNVQCVTSLLGGTQVPDVTPTIHAQRSIPSRQTQTEMNTLEL